MVRENIKAATEILKALTFISAKNIDVTDYKTELVDLLIEVSDNIDTDTIVAGILCDIFINTNASTEEVRLGFGNNVLNTVLELTAYANAYRTSPDKIRSAVEITSFLSPSAKLIKLCDLAVRMKEISGTTLLDNEIKSRITFSELAEKTVNKLKGINSKAETIFERSLRAEKAKLRNALIKQEALFELRFNSGTLIASYARAV
jgi:(p)ppGpp synthase/HD superfamily hydrolase